MRILLGLLIALILLPQESLEAEDYYSPANILRFAEHLYNEGDYLKAASEYQRYLFFSKESEGSIIYQIGLCYRKGGDLSKAYEWFERIIKEYLQSELLSSAYYQRAASLLLMERYEDSISEIKEGLDKGLDKGDEERLHYLLGLNYLKQKRWDDSWVLFSSIIVQDKDLRDSSSRLKRYAQEGKTLSRKSPILAGLLSSILPGAGKVYAGRSKDGLFSLLAVGITAWLSYDSLREDKDSTRGVIFGTMSGLFYGGNIYGSSIAAKAYNRRAEDDLLAKIQIEVDLIK